MTKAMTMEINRLSDALGAEVIGLDLTTDLDSATADAIAEAIREHLFLVIRDQHVEPGIHQKFCMQFGEIQAQRVGSEIESEEFSGMMFVGNAREDGMLQNGEMWFHSDQCYFEKPNAFTSLHAIIVTKFGGHTRFSNCRAAYDALSDEMKERVASLKGVNYYDYASANETIKTTARAANTHHYAHPLARTHPNTGHKSLYLNRLMTDEIAGMETAESELLLKTLFDHVESDEFVYEHTWRVGDLSIWDNRCVLHARTDFDPAEPRLLRRFCVIGDVPF